MKIIRTKAELQSAINHNDKIGFVPTMGALHAGHLSLVKLARENSDFVVASVFVNPTQFAPNEDFDSYPRDEKGDAAMLESAGADILFSPTAEVLYHDGFDSDIKAGSAAQGLEATFRPTHFDGVVNVVARLFDAVKPDIAVFGEKDYQQLQVLTEMVKTYNMPVEIIGAPILRDEHGLALSSRNAYLSADELKIARKLNVIVRKCAQDKNINSAKETILDAGFKKMDYIEERWGRILVAAWLGKTRLIDNISVN